MRDAVSGAGFAGWAEDAGDQRPAALSRLAEAVGEAESGLPLEVRAYGEILLAHIEGLRKQALELTLRIHARVRSEEQGRRLLEIPGVGPITAAVVLAFAPPMEHFARGRDFSAWLGLVPRQHSTGGKSRLGRVSKMGQRDVRRLLITGAMSVIRWALRRREPAPVG